MLTIACVKWGEKYGPEYVHILRDMVRRNLAQPHRFVCLTDNDEGLGDIDTSPLPEGLEGWWNKIELFRPGRFMGRVAFFDLDVAITGDLTELVERKGIIEDWHLPTYNSSVMVWDAGEHEEAFTKFSPEVTGRMHGDQDWLTMIGGWDTFPASWCVSYRSHAVEWPPLGARVVCFHGEPKPHQIEQGWVTQFWKIGGLKALKSGNGMNVSQSIAVEQMRENCKRNVPWLQPASAHAGSLVICGGGPSLKDNLGQIRDRKRRKQTVMALNNSWRVLVENKIDPDIISMMDARPENLEFVKDAPEGPLYLLASQTHPSVFEALKDHKVCLWNACIKEPIQREILDQYNDRPTSLIGGGGTVGLRMIFVGFVKGYRRFHLYGLDSCYRDGSHHAYAQSLNDGEMVQEIIFRDKTYQCAPWMARQANEFKDAYKAMIERGATIAAHGDGLLPDICRQMNKLRFEILKAAEAA